MTPGITIALIWKTIGGGQPVQAKNRTLEHQGIQPTIFPNILNILKGGQKSL